MATDEAAFIEREKVYLGTPAQFIAATVLYDSRMLLRHGNKGHFCYAFYSNSPPSELASSARIEIRPAKLWTRQDLDTGIAAQTLPNQRSLLVLWCKDRDWPEIEPYWLDLIAELSRLGYIEAGEAELVVAKPEPVAPKPRRGGGSVPEPLKDRAFAVFEWEKAREQQPGLSGDAFIALRQLDETNDIIASGSSLYRWQRDPEVQAYIERHYRSSAITQQRHSQESKP